TRRATLIPRSAGTPGKACDISSSSKRDNMRYVCSAPHWTTGDSGVGVTPGYTIVVGGVTVAHETITTVAADSSIFAVAANAVMHFAQRYVISAPVRVSL